MAKKKIIIIVSVAAVVAVALLAYLQVLQNKGKDQKSPQPEVVSPSEPSPYEKRTSIDDQKNAAEIKKTFDEFSKEAPKNEEGFSSLRLIDKNQNPVSLDDFARSVGMGVSPEIRNLLNPSDFNAMSCRESNGQIGHGIVMTVKSFGGSYKGDLYTDELNFMKSWEKSLLTDTKGVLFPGVNFGEAGLKDIEFKDGKYRYADVSLPDGKKSSINYTIVFDWIIITNSYDCIDKIASSFEALEP